MTDPTRSERQTPPEDAAHELREALRDYAAHQSWRCEHPPHYYFAGDPPDDGDCACGLLGTLKRLGIDPDGYAVVQ